MIGAKLLKSLHRGHSISQRAHTKDSKSGERSAYKVGKPPRELNDSLRAFAAL